MIIRLMDRNRFPVLAAMVLYLLIQGLTFRTGVGMEEFRDLWMIRAMEASRLPLRDFVVEYGPVGPFFWYGVTRLIGTELFAIRLISVLMGLPILWLSCCVANRLLQDRWAVAAIGFCASGLVSFPLYSYTHVLSVLTLLAALLSAVRLLESGFIGWHLFCALLSIVTVFIRPLPTGIVLVGTVLTVLLLSPTHGNNLRSNRALTVIIYGIIVIVGVVAGVVGYAVVAGFPVERWYALTFVSGSPLLTGNLLLLAPRLPNPVVALVSFWMDIMTCWTCGVVILAYKTGALLNLLAGHIAYLVAFVVPAAAFTWLAARRIFPSAAPIENSGTLWLLSICSLGLGLHYHNVVTEPFHQGIKSGGYIWNTVGGFLLQPGLIIGLALTYRLTVRIRLFRYAGRRLENTLFVPRLIIGVFAAYLVLAPKLQNLRYLAVPMVTTDLPGVRGLYLNNYFEKATLPAIEHLQDNRDEMPDHLFSPLPVYTYLASQEPAFPEYYYTGLWGDDSIIIGATFPGMEVTGPITLGEFILWRLARLKPIVVLDSPVADYSPVREATYAWTQYVSENYVLHHTFVSENPITSEVGSSSVYVYLPDE